MIYHIMRAAAIGNMRRNNLPLPWEKETPMIDFTKCKEHVRKPEDNFYLGQDCNGIGLEQYRTIAQELAQEHDGLDDPLQHRGEFHITVLDPKELKKLVKGTPYLKTRFFPIDRSEIEVLGIGRASDDLKGKVAYFLVVKWPHAQEFRKAYGLLPKDLHITLGFIKGDVFNAPKDEASLVWKPLNV